MNERQRKLYRKPILTCYADIRTITLGTSIIPGESPGHRSVTPFANEDFGQPQSRGGAEDSGGRRGRQ